MTKRSVWILFGQRLPDNGGFWMPSPRAVYFSKSDGEKRIEYLDRTTGGKFKYYLLKAPFFTESKKPASWHSFEDHGLSDAPQR